MGRDVFSQILVGCRVSVLAGIGTGVISVLIGTMVGFIAGYVGGKIDSILMRIVDLFYALPSQAFIIIVAIVFGDSLTSLIVAMSLMFWRSSARVVRAETLVLKNETYIEAARAIGASGARILFRHVAPGVLPVTGVYLPITIGYAVISEATVSFLGFGPPESMSWGKMLNQAFQTGGLTRGAWWWIIPPGLAILFFVTTAFDVNAWMQRRLLARRPVQTL